MATTGRRRSYVSRFDELERALAAEGRMLDRDFLNEMLRTLPRRQP
jgi:phage regulator Rha-like protein